MGRCLTDATILVFQGWLSACTGDDDEAGADRCITLGDRSHIDLREYLKTTVDPPCKTDAVCGLDCSLQQRSRSFYLTSLVYSAAL